MCVSWSNSGDTQGVKRNAYDLPRGCMMSNTSSSRFTFYASPIMPLLVLFFCLATLYNAIVPLGEGPDEPGHLDYSLFLARERQLPVQRASLETSDVPGEGHQPPLAYLLALPAVAWLPDDKLYLNVSANPHFLWNGGTEPAAFMRSGREYWPWQGQALAWHLVRGVSTLLGMLTVFCVWGAARTLNVHTPTLPLLAAALVAFNPQFLFTSALATNDALLAALSAGLFWLCLAWTTFGRWWALLAGVLLGLALLTKQSALLLVPLLMWASWRASKGNWRTVILLAIQWSSLALLIAGWWYVRNWQLYGDPFGLSVFQAEYTTQAFDWHNPAAWYGALVQLHASFWARFGWMSLRPPAWVIWMYTTLGIVALGGLLKRFGFWILDFRRKQGPSASNLQKLSLKPESSWLAVILLPIVAFAWTVSFALTAGLVAWQGRMLFPALPAIALLLAFGLLAWSADMRQHTDTPTGRQTDARINKLPQMAGSQHFIAAAPLRGGLFITGLAALMALALYVPLGIIKPAYPWYTTSPAVAQARIETPVYARFAQSWERGVELRGWRLDGTTWPGQTITITLTWHTLERVPRDWTIFVHLLDETGQIRAQDNRHPQSGAFPMTLWTPGDWVDDPHPIALPADLPPGHYALNVGLYRPEKKGRRQSAWAEDGTRLDNTVNIGAVTVER